MSLWISGLLPAAIGVALLLWAVRGRQIDNHPRCRKCGYNLHALNTMDTPCPECGACVSSPRTIRIGSRKRRLKALALAIMLLAIAAPILSVQSYLAYSGTTWIEHAPYSVLRWQAKNNDAGTRNQVNEELFSRHREGEITDQQVIDIIEDAVDQMDQRNRRWNECDFLLAQLANNSGFMPPALWERMLIHMVDSHYDVKGWPTRTVMKPGGFVGLGFYIQTDQITDTALLYAADKVLAYQADRSQHWDPWRAMPLVEAQDRGILPEEKWLLYLRQAMEHAYTLDVRPIVRVGDPVPYRLVVRDLRFHNAPTVRIMSPQKPTSSFPRYERAVSQARFGEFASLGISHSESYFLNSNGYNGEGEKALRFTPEQWERVEPGFYQLSLDIELAFFEAMDDGSMRHDLVRVSQTHTAEIEVVTSDLPIQPGPVFDELEDPLQLRRNFGPSLYASETEDGWRVRGMLHLGYDIPVAVYADIVLVSPDGREWPLGPITEPTGIQESRTLALARLAFLEQDYVGPMPDLDTLWIELRPNTELTLTLIEPEPFWGQTIVINRPSIELRNPPRAAENGL